MTMTQEAATADLALLNSFVGIWDTEGEVGTGASAVRFEGTDEYEWLPGGHFLLHKFRARMPDGENAGIEVISRDETTDGYSMRSFDSTGASVVMSAHRDGDRWVFLGELMRFSGGFSPDGRQLSGVWELRSGEGSTWNRWMTVTLSKRMT